jgi:drug/metabolite transporter (DMT)-like permease
MNPVTRAYIELHIAVFLFGFTAILGDLISLSAINLVWWRVFLTSISLLFLINSVRLFRTLPRRRLWQFLGIGVLVALHWLAFFGSIKLANASIALVAVSTTSFFTSLIEPLFMRQRIKWYEIGLGVLIVPGMILVVNGAEASVWQGLLAGFAAAFLASLFTTLNKKLLGQYNAMEVTFLELGSAWAFLSLVLPVYFLVNDVSFQTLMPGSTDWIYLIVLALLCTTLGYVLALRSLRELTAFAGNLTVNLEPVYGIIMAWLILNENEELTGNFYWGVAIILLAVFSYPILRRLEKKGEDRGIKNRGIKNRRIGG